MNAVVRDVVVGKDRRIVIDLPPDIPEGPAEVIVLARGETKTDIEGLIGAADGWRRAHPGHRRSKEDIDRQVTEERGSWERDG